MKFLPVLFSTIFIASSAVVFSQEDMMQEQPQVEESPGIEQMNGSQQDLFQEPAQMPQEQPFEESDGMIPSEEALPQERLEEQVPQEAVPMEEEAEQQDWGRDRDRNGKDENGDKDWDKDKKDKEHDKDWDKRRKDKKHDKDWDDWDDGPSIDFGISIGFTEEAFYLPPPRRVAVFDPVLMVEPGVAVFVEKTKVVEPECLFPQDGYYTILAPTDEAFREIAADVEDQSELCEILDQYVVPELIILDDIEEEATFTALAGNEIVITRKGNDFFIGDVRIVKPMANKDKGVIVHVIDGTLE